MIFYLVIGGVFLWWIFTRNSSNKLTYKYVDPKTGKSRSDSKNRRSSQEFISIEKPNDFVITPEVQEVLNALENEGSNVFLTGRAGTGKSTLLKYFRATTQKQIVVVAPTGVAAVNVQGQTIHSFFGWGIDITPDRVRKQSYERSKIYRQMKMLIIDEISMVRADIFECVDVFLRINGTNPNKPFGGVQIVVIGDLYQLPPVVKSEEQSFFKRKYRTPFFFSTDAFEKGNFRKFELKNVFRQTDQQFISALNAIREGVPTTEHIELLNSCVIDREPDDFKSYVHLVPTNKMAKEINENRMAQLEADPVIYKGSFFGTFTEKNAPTDIELELRAGAQVMLINNDKDRRWVNGDIVKVLETKETSIMVEFSDQTAEEITPHSWENVRFIFDEEEEKIVPKKVGGFTQLPVKAAWAMTIHKSQGKTFDKMFLDLGSGSFAEGQTYVALSRCKSLQGLKLSSPLRKEDVFINEDVKEFMSFASELKVRSSNRGQLKKDLQPRVSTQLVENLLSKEEFVITSIHKLRKDGYKGIHAVYSGFNEAFRQSYQEDPVAVVQNLAEKGVVVIRPVRGGVMIYDAKEYSNRK